MTQAAGPARSLPRAVLLARDDRSRAERPSGQEGGWSGLSEPRAVHASAAQVSIHPLQIRVKCNEDDTIGDLKKLVAAQTGECLSRCTSGPPFPGITAAPSHPQAPAPRRFASKSGTPSTRTTSPWPTTRSTTAWVWSFITIKSKRMTEIRPNATPAWWGRRRH